MPKASRKNRAKNRNIENLSVAFQPVERPIVAKPKIATQTYDAFRYIKKDLMWSAVAAGVVVVVLIIFYIFLR
jgi:hypothetical protein